MKKFELTSEFVTFLGEKLFRIKALVSFGDVAEGELGGFIKKENNLDQSGNAWVYGDALVYGNARVSGNARVYGDAQVYGDAWVSGNAWASGNAWVYGDAWVQCCRDYSAASCFGSKNRTTTFFRTKDDGIGVRCGCFYGTLEEFREKVKERHGDSRLAKEYLTLADAMEFRLSKDE